MTEDESGVPRAGEIVPGTAGEAGRPAEAAPMPDQAEDIVERAIESVLEQVPDVPDEGPPEGGAKYQPWADIQAPPSKDKRPLQDLLDEYAARVAADPDARAPKPSQRSPIVAFYDRFGPARRQSQRGESAEGGGGRRRRGRRQTRRGRGRGRRGGGGEAAG